MSDLDDDPRGVVILLDAAEDRASSRAFSAPSRSLSCTDTTLV
jgi:hypothetical protein